MFLTANAFLMIILVFMIYSKDSMTILNVIKKFAPEGPSMSSDEAENLNDLINKEINDENYKPTKGEIFQLFTICKNEEEFKETALAGGL